MQRERLVTFFNQGFDLVQSLLWDRPLSGWGGLFDLGWSASPDDGGSTSGMRRTQAIANNTLERECSGLMV